MRESNCKKMQGARGGRENRGKHTSQSDKWKNGGGEETGDTNGERQEEKNGGLGSMQNKNETWPSYKRYPARGAVKEGREKKRKKATNECERYGE